LEDFLELELNVLARGAAGSGVECSAIAGKGGAPTTAAVPRLAGEGAAGDEHGGDEAEQAGQHGPDEDAGDGVEDFAEVVDGVHGGAVQKLKR
jgi:hypothetical protein